MFKVDYNPDVLSCLANLSNDEVFTPPNVANQVLDLLPDEIWNDKNITFLDPVSKSGVFLREITKRLLEGLKDEIPDRQKRINHILKNQVFGIAITELTSLLSRRSLYCTKFANGKYSICDEFESDSGNILFKKIKHKWIGNKCEYCNASKEVYDRDNILESHAYHFIHTDEPKEIFNMKFDVIIGNPPYQLSDGGFGKSAKPIYHKFIEQAKKLNPRYMSMIVPARWYNGGKGLDSFRKDMLNDDRLSELHDFPDTSDCFPGINIRGGICYFLWEKNYKGDCNVISHKGDKVGSPIKRPLLEKGLNIFIRYNEAMSIFKKVRTLNENPFNTIVSTRKPFGLATNFSDFKNSKGNNSIYLYRFGDNGYVSKNQIEKNKSFVDDWKVLVPKASPGDDSYPHLILSKPIVAEPNSCCTETYIVVGPFKNKEISNNVAQYMLTSFFRFMVLLAKSTQDVTKKTYVFVPMQDFNKTWDDKALYDKYNISDDEQKFINSLIRSIDYKYE